MRFEVVDPSTAQVIASVAQGDSVDIDLTVRAARRSFADRRWRGLGADERAQILWRYATLIEKNADELVHLKLIIYRSKLRQHGGQDLQPEVFLIAQP